ncbi:MAG: hypothetical protein IKP65_04130 [Alphaproteobacteria bacterium]|nr:hypothetical protein [Alphaproteobacteria bacterium]
MTKLSIFLWLADSVTGLSTLFTIGGVIGVIVLTVVFCVAMEDEWDFRDIKWFFIITVPLTLLSILLAIFIPTKKTLYMIAGVEMTNTIMETEDFKKVKSYLGDTGIQMLDDIKSIIHKEAIDAINSTKETK